MGMTKLLLDENDYDGWPIALPDQNDDLIRLIQAWGNLSRERKQIILGIAENIE